MAAIHDLFIKPLSREEFASGWRLPLLRYSDHLLRRFGLAEAIQLAAGASLGPIVRRRADEAWALLEGQVEFDWEDQREGSPTRGRRHSLRCDRPTLVLAPFGVAFSCRALDGPAMLVRLATHAEDESAES